MSKPYNETLERISDRIRSGEPVGYLEAIAAINYQQSLRDWEKRNSFFARLWRWVKGDAA